MIKWEKVATSHDSGPYSCDSTVRAKIYGGWLLKVDGGEGEMTIAFIPDPLHKWDGNSLD